MKNLILIFLSLGLVACAPDIKDSATCESFKSERHGIYFLDAYSQGAESFRPLEGQKIAIWDRSYTVETLVNGEYILDSEGCGPRDMGLDFEKFYFSDLYFYGVKNGITYRYKKVR